MVEDFPNLQYILPNNDIGRLFSKSEKDRPRELGARENTIGRSVQTKFGVYSNTLLYNGVEIVTMALDCGLSGATLVMYGW